MNLQEPVLPVQRNLLHFVVARLTLFTHSLAILLELAEADLTLLVHVKDTVLQAFQINLGGTGVDLFFDLVDLLFNFTEPVVESLFHLSWIDPTIFHNLGALNQVRSRKGR